MFRQLRETESETAEDLDSGSSEPVWGNGSWSRLRSTPNVVGSLGRILRVV